MAATLRRFVNGVLLEMTEDEADAFTAGQTPPETLECKRARIWEAIKAERDRRVQHGGYKVTIAAVDHWFHSDTFSRLQQIGLVMFGAQVPAVPWKTMAGEFVTMTPAIASQVFAAAAAADMATFAHAESLRAALDAVADPTSVDLSAGWPAVFGEG